MIGSLSRRGPMLLIALAALIMLAAATYRLRESPAIWYDEGYYTQVAMNIAEHGRQALQVAPGSFVSTAYVTVGYPLFTPVALSYKLFGAGVVQGRAVMALFILAFALVSFLFIRALYGTRAAAFSLLLLATLPTLYGNGKSVLGEVPGMFYLVSSLYALALLEQRGYRGRLRYGLVGLLVGLAVVTKPIYLLFLPALFIAFLIALWRRAPIDGAGFALALLALLAPVVLWFLLQFGADASVTSVLGYYANPYDISNVGSLILENAKRFLTEITPLYALVMTAVWAFALFLARKTRRLGMAECAAFVFTLFILLDYLRIAEWYRYLFPAILLALLFFAPSALALAARLAPRVPRLPVFCGGALLLLAALQLYQTAFDSYVAGYYQSDRVENVRQAFAPISATSSVFLYNVPELAVLLPSRDYYQYLDPQPNLTIGAAELPVLAGGGPDFVVAPDDVYNANPLFARYHLIADTNGYAVLAR